MKTKEELSLKSSASSEIEQDSEGNRAIDDFSEEESIDEYVANEDQSHSTIKSSANVSE